LPDEISVISSNRIKRSAFKNSFIVPETKFDFNSITAKFEDGLLTITIPPKEKKEYKQITIA
jgi:HSP20 family molecular chaperone IbpA